MLNGTSMAAPIVTGLAALLTSTLGLPTSTFFRAAEVC